jgi:AraC family transcriptional regulator
MGSPRFRTVEIEGLGITEARFPPGAYLPPHVHDRAIFCVMLEGSFDVVFRSKTLACPPAAIHTEPLAERHANRIEGAGAHVLVLQPDPRREQLLRPWAPLLDRISHLRHAGIAALAARLCEELRASDSAAPLAAESLALEMLARATRADAERGHALNPPAWLLRAQEIVHAKVLEPLGVAALAAEVGVHPSHLARSFRRHFRTTVGDYHRQLRLRWAAERLADSDASIAEIALRAGFADQSHFTRAFRRFAGEPPGRFRRAGSRRAPPEPNGD